MKTDETDQTSGLLRFYPTASREHHPLSDGDVCIGRAPPCEIVIVSDLVSRRHARLEQVDARWRIADLDSANGLFVNARRVSSRILTDRDVIRIGAALFRFMSGPAVTDPCAIDTLADELQALLEGADPLELPPLRERPEDVPLLVQHFLGQEGREQGFTVEAMERLCCGAWPGNVAELERTVKQAVERAEAGVRLDLEHLDQDPSQQGELTQVLQRHGGDVNAAAAELGISRSQLYRRAQKLGLRIADFRR